MTWLSAPKIISCKTKHTLICDGNLTPIVLRIDGWGLLKITAPKQLKWPWFFCPLVCRQHEFVLNVPMNTELVIQAVNLLGFTQQRYQVPAASTLLKTIHAPTVPALYITFIKHSIPALELKGIQPAFWFRRVVFSLNQALINTPSFMKRHSIRPYISLPKTVIKRCTLQLNLPKLEVKFKPFPQSSIND